MDSFHRAPVLRLMRNRLCTSCVRALRVQVLRRNSRVLNSRSKSYIARSGEQANPLSGYYTELLSQPHRVAASTRPPTTSSSKDQEVKAERDERIAKARLVFGSRLAGPIERRKKVDEQSTLIAGVLVPPRPQEPDNCCMSGCVNCVWDVYRDDLEYWAAKTKEAREKLAQQKRQKQEKSARKPLLSTNTSVASSSTPAPDSTLSHAATSMDDDGGGSDTNWDRGLDIPDAPQEDLFGGIPVGIREFMKTEKRLKEKHRAEGTRYSY
ncbi:uncharacterized protein PV09_01042 [Verruconis gallopava]|uniref:Oxidoreductase-like domain-containing protein n=1 Tax=Verruconis gallopava TaxID=253628 RepID=A0A0D2BA16_9PEZI|nr:uncharacterized protein PV09_01042 [Verruconis gallopava]KIW08104.1 hypothetical protein PV09_01042 [Verruconis gallopava]